MSKSYAFTKRAFDLVCASFGIVVTSPLLIAVAVAIKWTSPGPLFYRGVRVGRHGKAFKIFKFRTMVVDAERLGGASTSNADARITAVGRFLRSCKLDELPQLLNVLSGDMSLVGPRPEVQKYVDMYSERERPILQLRPGITDWASIWNADEGAVLAQAADPDRAYEELIRPTKLTLQLKYAHECSLSVDLKILVATALRLGWRDWMPSELAAYTPLIASTQRS
jgi:lipopolysaccharide/colanic/teichoic acid biosynthesis glycosyltransferase